MRRTLYAVLAVLVVAGIAIATDLYYPPYIDYRLMGGTTSAVIDPYKAPGKTFALPGLSGGNYGIYVDTFRMAAGVQRDTLSIRREVINPIIWPLTGTVTLIVGIPTGVQNGYLFYPTSGDSWALQIPGRFKTFIVAKTGTADSVNATTYCVLGRIPE